MAQGSIGDRLADGQVLAVVSSRFRKVFRNSCCKAEPPLHFPLHLLIVPVRVLVPYAGADQLARKLIQLEANLQAPLRRRGAVEFDLLLQAVVGSHCKWEVSGAD
jgi:hypothetical protein